MSRPPTVKDIRPVPVIRESIGNRRPTRGRASSPMLVLQPLSSSTPAQAAVKQTFSSAPPDVDTICDVGPDVSMRFDLHEFGSLEDYAKPEHAVKLENFIKARKEFWSQRSERKNLNHIAMRNEILQPRLICKVVHTLIQTNSH